MSADSELLLEQFYNYERIAKSIIGNLRRPRDIEISRKLLKQCQTYATNTSDLEVLEWTNEFLRYFLRVMSWAERFQPQNLYDVWYGPESTAYNQIVPAHWSEDKTTYLAMKTMDDGSLLVYLAIARDPTQWVEEGLSRYKADATCKF